MFSHTRWSGMLAATVALSVTAAAAEVVHPLAHAAPASHVSSRTAIPSPESERDPALTEGVLPNGLRYYLRVNHAPAHRVEFRLAVNAGSVLEDHDQRGLAHFLEHMMFDGTHHFPYNPHDPRAQPTARSSIIQFFETNGMRFGGDFNAETTPDETIYEFTLPTNEHAVVRRGLDLLQDWADGGTLIDSSAVLGERGVVMGEWRFRVLADTATMHARAAGDSVWFGDSQYIRRSSIGDTTVIETAEPGPIRRYYHDWYRPDLMAVVVVGDFDRDEMLHEIERRFGRIRGPRHERPRVQPKIALGEAPYYRLFRGPVLPAVRVYWPTPPEPASVEGRVRDELIRQLRRTYLQQRLLAMQEQPSRPFISASLQYGPIVRPLRMEGFSAIAQPESLYTTLTDLLVELQRVAQHGIPAGVLAEQKENLLREWSADAGDALATQSATYADRYVDFYLTGQGTLLNAQQRLAIARRVLPGITPAVVAEAERRLLASQHGQRIVIDIPTFSPVASPTRRQILALFDSVGHLALPAATGETLAESPLVKSPPAPGRITGEVHDPVSGTTSWTLSNGARVILKPSANDPGQLLIRAWGPGGFSRMPDTLFYSPGRMVAKAMTAAEGLGGQGHDAVQQRLAATGVTTFRVNIGYADQTIDLGGMASQAETLMQLLYLQFTAPRLDTTEIHSWASLAKYEGADVTLDDQLNQIFSGGNPRLLPVDPGLADFLTPGQALAAYRNRFGNAANFTFILVGALTPSQARPLVERYIASLPSTGAHETVKPIDVNPFASTQENTSANLPFPEARTIIMFDGPIPASPPARYLEEQKELQAVATVLRGRTLRLIRMRMSADYSPALTASTYELPIAGESPEHFRVIGSFVTTPERMRDAWRAYARVVDALRTDGASATELQLAETTLQRQYETALQSNEFWLNTIQRYTRLGIPLSRIPNPYGSAPVSPQAFSKAARKFLPKDAYIHITQTQEDTTAIGG